MLGHVPFSLKFQVALALISLPQQYVDFDLYIRLMPRIHETQFWG